MACLYLQVLQDGVKADELTEEEAARVVSFHTANGIYRLGLQPQRHFP